MRKGWKTRMDEREYFENKRNEREARMELMKIALLQARMDIERLRNELSFKGHHETH